MTWLPICLIAATIYAFSTFIDNYLSNAHFKGYTPQAIKVIDGPACLITAICLVTYHGIYNISPAAIVLCTLAGVLNTLADIPYYLGFRGHKTTSMTIMLQLSPVFYLIADYLIFRNTITPVQIIGFLFLISAPFVIFLSDYKHHQYNNKTKIRAAILIAIAALIYAFSDLLFAHSEGNFDYISLFFYFLVGQGVSSAIISLFHKRWRKRFLVVATRSGFKFHLLYIFNTINYTVTDLLYRYALIIGPAAAASVTTNSSQLTLTFILGILLTKIWPNFGREKLTKYSVRAHFIATALAIIGIIIIQ